MLQKHLFWIFAIVAVFMTACSEDGPPRSGEVPNDVIEAFEAQYPGATDVSWTTQDGYAIASFTINEVRSTQATGRNKAWYLMSNARWAMSNYEIPYSALPQAVKTAFEASEYAYLPWHRDDDVDVINRNGYDVTLYVIDVEKEENGVETEVDLYYAEDGILVNTVIDAETDRDFSDFLPETTPTGITEWLNQNFPNARIVEIDNEDGGIEVEIIYNGMKHEIFFTSSMTWVYTKTEYERRHLGLIEDVVLQALRTSPYYTSDNKIDDIDRYETAASGVFYCFELETRFDDDVDVYITESGEILSSRPSLGDNTGAAVNSEIEEFIAQRYPGAVILEKDNDDGYIEVEIRHEGIEKEVLFNGKYEWVRTEWEIHHNNLPQEIIDVVVAAGYAASQIDDDVDVIETAEGLTYEVEIEPQDIKLIITNGVIVRVIND